MKVKYRTVKGTIAVEVEEELAEVIKEEERYAGRIEKLEHRHCWNRNMFEDKEDWPGSYEDDPFYNLGRETWEEEVEHLHRAISQLTEEQQKLIDYVYYKGYSFKAFAEIEGVHPSAITRRHQVIIKKLREIF